MRAMWTGELAFGLVTIPVKLYSATRDLTPQFKQLHKECGSNIAMARRCPKCERDIAWEEIGKGYEVTKGHYALFTAEELAALDGEDAAGGVDIVEFIDPRDVDPAYVEKTYWIGPGGNTARGFELLRSVLEETGKVALAKVKIRTRTRLGLVRPHGRLFSLDMMRFGDELVSSTDIVIPDAKVSAAELGLARKIVKQLTARFDATRHPDSYRAALGAAVEAKVEAHQVVTDVTTPSGVVARGKLVDLEELLARSLTPANESDEAPDSRRRGARKTRTKSHRPAARRAS